jgi:hypothetical protein
MKKLLIIAVFFLTSCNSLLSGGFTFNGANYNYDYYVYNKKLDNSDVHYVLNPTNYSNSNLSEGSYLESVVDFFNDKLKNKITLKNKYKDSNGKIVIPFPINFDITDEQVQFLKENTDLDYIILSKIVYLNEMNTASLSSLNVKRLQTASDGAISFIKVLDIKTNIALIEMSCAADVTINEARDIQTGVREFQSLTIHKDSYSLGDKTMKKLLKKIK